MEAVANGSTSKEGVTKVLIADDDAPTRILLRAAVSQWGYEMVEAKDGQEAWDIMQKPDSPRLAIIDWQMPKIDGITICERSKKELSHYPYIILLTQVSGSANLVAALEAGADEFLSKPFNMAELHSRLSIGKRIVEYQTNLIQRKEKIQNDLDKIKSRTNSLLALSKKSTPTQSDNICQEQEKVIHDLLGGLEEIDAMVVGIQNEINHRE
ncbi:MAG: response regulator transcription factor [Gammaproteobacteria bacterium]